MKEQTTYSLKKLLKDHYCTETFATLELLDLRRQ